MHSWSGGRCLDLGIGEILGVWHWFHPTIQLDQLMLLLLLLPGKWLRLEKKTGYCPEIFVPDREMWLGWPMNAKGWWNRPRGRMLTCFRHIFSMLEPAGTRSCDEKFGIVMSGWPDSAWSASWRMIVRNIQNMFMSKFWNRTCINGESTLYFLGVEGECCAWWKSKENDAKFRIMGEFKYLLSKQNNTWTFDDVWGGVLWESSSPPNWCLGAS